MSATDYPAAFRSRSGADRGLPGNPHREKRMLAQLGPQRARPTREVRSGEPSSNRRISSLEQLVAQCTPPTGCPFPTATLWGHFTNIISVTATLQ